MDRLIVQTFCIAIVGGLLLLPGIYLLSRWREPSGRSAPENLYGLRSRCAELERMLESVKDQRNRLARRVVELEAYYAPLQRSVDDDFHTIMNLNREKQQLQHRLDGARILCLALAQKAGIDLGRESADVGDQWRVV